MKIKEVENRVGMPRANIRFYEKEGLLSAPVRNENNYREYTEADVEQLQRIKILRMLGVALADIKMLNEDEISMEEVMLKRLTEIEREVKEMQDVQKICETILDHKIEVASLDETILTGDSQAWKRRLEEVFEKDIVKEKITRYQLNTHIYGMISWGYLINAFMALAVGDRILNQQPATYDGMYNPVSLIFNVSFVLYAGLLLAVVCGIGIFWTSSMKWQLVFFHVSALITTPVLIGLSKIWDPFDANPLKPFSGREFAAYWLCVIIYVNVLYLVSRCWNKMFTKVRYSLAVAAVVDVICILAAYQYTGTVLVPALAFTFILFYIALVWTTTNMDREEYNRYYAVVASCKIMNLVGTLFGQQGRGRSSAWMK